MALVGLLGCDAIDPRPRALRRGMDQARSVLAERKLKALADKRQEKTPEERLVGALFSYEARGLWPPRLASEYDFNSRDQAKLPGRIAYLLEPDLPWAVVIQALPKQHRIQIDGYGTSIEKPLWRESLEVAP